MRGPDRLGLLALGLAAAAWGVDAAALLAWPAQAGKTLVGLFALVGLSRLAQQVSGWPHPAARSVIVGIAATGVLWFGVAAILAADLALGALALGHGLVMAVALPRAHGDPPSRRLVAMASVGGLVLSAFARAMATTKASKHQAETSSTAAQAIAMAPTRDCIKLRSVRMRASTGNAVTLIAVPKNNANGRKATPLGA